METLLKNSGLVWFIAGIVMMLLEFLIPGFVIFFFGVGAILTALFTWSGAIESTSLQFIVFIVTSILSLVLLRNKGRKYFRGNVSEAEEEGMLSDDIIGEKVIVSEEINPAKLTGKVELHGTMWNAVSDNVIAAGELVEITGRKDLSLNVKKIAAD
jgi:membrane protein implicated in regulation of membrane protease activity